MDLSHRLGADWKMQGSYSPAPEEGNMFPFQMLWIQTPLLDTIWKTQADYPWLSPESPAYHQTDQPLYALMANFSRGPCQCFFNRMDLPLFKRGLSLSNALEEKTKFHLLISPYRTLFEDRKTSWVWGCTRIGYLENGKSERLISN